MTRFRFCLILALTLVLVACGGGSSDESEAVPESATTTTTEPAEDEVEARCGLTGRYKEVPCDEPHDAEFAGVVPLPEEPSDITAMAACAESVEELAGRPTTSFGVDVGFVPLEDSDELECWAEVSAEDTLSASIREEGLEAALGDFVFVADLDIGTCHELADPQEESFDIAMESECDAERAQVVFARFEADDGPAPDDDTVDDFFDQCLDLAEEDDFEDVSDDWYIISPLDSNWEALDRRTILCVTPSTSGVDVDPSAQVGSVCANYDADLQDYPIVPCDEPHRSEFAGSVTPPDEVLPDDRDEATLVLNQLCRDRVEELTGRSLSRFGSGVGFVTEDGLGQPMVRDIRCYVSVPLDGAFIDAIGDVGYEDALAYEVIVDLEPGTCFSFVEDSVSFGEVVSCDAPGALVLIGGYEAEGPPGSPYPGEDALRDERAERCEELLAESGLEVEPGSVSGTIPDEEAWLSYDLRQVACDATPA